ncbi:MAG: C69 family dipeptidase [Selenomonadaceae bacterium]|nr:C69 family dipeptidase [Selenomonadaceae bacterium]
MKNFLSKIVVVLVALLLVSSDVSACTIMLVTKGASTDGSVFVSHSNDAFGSDPNVVFVPAKNHKRGSLRPVYPSAAATGIMPEYNCFDFPYLVAPERSDAYNYPDKPQTKPIGYIPEVEHTYAYIDAEYPVMNEHGLMLGECTDKSEHLPELPYKDGGGFFYSAELGRVALERCKTAREAIELMGALIDEYGLYGTAEAFFVADKNEGWLFEMQPTPSGKGGLWIAEKIPDGHFSVAANQLRIRAIRQNDPNQIFNPKLPQMLEELGWTAYDANGNLDWVKSLRGAEWNHPYYSMRRVWSALNTVAPSLNLSPTVDDWDSDYYPLSVRLDKKLTVTDVMSLYRDYYNDTEFDKSASKFAGLYGSPYHYENEKRTERGILAAKTSYTHVAQVNDKLPAPICRVSINTPFENSFVPFAVAKIPAAYEKALRDTYDTSKMYWASAQVMALTQGYWNIMSPIVAQTVQQSEKNSLKLVESSQGLSKNKFVAALNQNAVKVFDDWKNLYTKLLLKYDAGAGVKYDEKNLPEPDAPTKY